MGATLMIDALTTLEAAMREQGHTVPLARPGAYPAVSACTRCRAEVSLELALEDGHLTVAGVLDPALLMECSGLEELLVLDVVVEDPEAALDALRAFLAGDAGAVQLPLVEPPAPSLGTDAGGCIGPGEETAKPFHGLTVLPYLGAVCVMAAMAATAVVTAARRTRADRVGVTTPGTRSGSAT